MRVTYCQNMDIESIDESLAGERIDDNVEVEEDGSRSTDQYEVTIYVTNEAAGALIGN